MALRANQKLAPRYYGPYEVVERIGQVAYKLKLPSDSVIHPVFHVSQLRKTIGDHRVTSELPAGGDTKEIMEPKEVVGSRMVGDQREVLIAWKGLPTSEATWELYEQMLKQFPHFHLGDKVVFQGGSYDMNRNKFGKKYQRRNKIATTGG